MGDVPSTESTMRDFAGPASQSTIDRVRSTTSRSITTTLSGLGITSGDVVEVATVWDSFRDDDDWLTLLAALVDLVERDRGVIDAPIPIWADLDDRGPNGRLRREE